MNNFWDDYPKLKVRRRKTQVNEGYEVGRIVHLLMDICILATKNKYFFHIITYFGKKYIYITVSKV